MGYTYSYEASEFTIGDRIFKSVNKVSASQPTEEEWTKGTQSEPLDRTVGSMDGGKGSAEFSDMDERGELVDMLAERGPYREVLWNCSYVMTRRRSDGEIRVQYIKCFECRLLDEPDEASAGSAIVGAIEFSFKKKSINDHFPHAGM